MRCPHCNVEWTKGNINIKVYAKEGEPTIAHLICNSCHKEDEDNEVNVQEIVEY